VTRRNRPQTYITIEVAEITIDREKAFLVVLKSGEEVWLPKSQIEDPDQFEAADCNVEMNVSEWIYNEKDLR
jgi:hypothetical protein